MEPAAVVLDYHTCAHLHQVVLTKWTGPIGGLISALSLNGLPIARANPPPVPAGSCWLTPHAIRTRPSIAWHRSCCVLTDVPEARRVPSAATSALSPTQYHTSRILKLQLLRSVDSQVLVGNPWKRLACGTIKTRFTLSIVCALVPERRYGVFRELLC